MIFSKDLHFQKYSIAPVALVVIMNFLTFNGTRLITTSMKHYDISICIDKHLPFLTFFILPYVLAFLQWGMNYAFLSCESKETVYRFCFADIVAKFLVMIIFLVFPTTMTRPEVSGSGIFDYFTRFIYFVDTPDNLFPSVHILESWLAFRVAFKLKNIKKHYTAYKVWNIIITPLVFMAILLVKQHVFFDILGGMAVAEIGLFVSNKYYPEKLFNKLSMIFKS